MVPCWESHLSADSQWFCPPPSIFVAQRGAVQSRFSLGLSTGTHLQTLPGTILWWFIYIYTKFLCQCCYLCIWYILLQSITESVQYEIWYIWGLQGPFYLENVCLQQQESASPSKTCLAKPLEARQSRFSYYHLLWNQHPPPTQSAIMKCHIMPVMPEVNDASKFYLMWPHEFDAINHPANFWDSITALKKWVTSGDIALNEGTPSMPQNFEDVYSFSLNEPKWNS